MNQTVAYTPTPLGEISGSLNAIFSTLERAQGESSILRPTSVNLITIAPSISDLNEFEQLLDSFAATHPGRIFIISIDDSLAGVQAEITAHCRLISQSQNVCSEVVKFTTPSSRLDSLPSLVLANMLVGTATELLLFKQLPSPTLIEMLAPITDVVMFDSAHFEQDLNRVAALTRLGAQLVDLQWISGAPWRDQINEVFQRFSDDCLIDRLAQIEICASVVPGAALPACALLMAGWMADRLNLDVFAYDRSSYECRLTRFHDGAAARRSLVLALRAREDSNGSRLEHVNFLCSSGGVTARGAELRLSRAEVLETVLDFGADSQREVYRFSRTLDDESFAGRLFRYFVIGESLVNYRPALKAALDLQGLRRGFSPA